MTRPDVGRAEDGADMKELEERGDESSAYECIRLSVKGRKS